MKLKGLLAALLLMMSGIQTAWSQKMILHMPYNQRAEYYIQELDSITFVDKESNNEVKMVVLNVFNDTEDADLLLLCDDGSYILCDGQNDEGYAVLYMNASIDNDFEEGVTIFLNENGTPVMASTKDGHYLFKNISANSFDFAYINNEDEISYYYDAKLDVQTDTPLSTRKKGIVDAIVDPYIDAWHTLYYDGHFQWDEHNKKALVPFLCKIASFAITAGNAVWGTGQLSLVHTLFYEWYKSGYYHSDLADKIFYWTEMALLGSSGVNIPNLITNGTVEFTPRKFSISYLAYLLNKYGDDKLAAIGQYTDRVGPVFDPEEWKISLNTNLLECQPYNKWYVVNVSSKAIWDIDDSLIDPDWCVVQKLPNNTQVSIHVTPNESSNERTCYLTIYAKTTTAIASVTLTIKQLGMQPGIVFELSEDEISFTQIGGSKPIYVTASEHIKEWEVTSYPSWCKIEKGNNTFWVDVEEYEKDRTGTIVVTALIKEEFPIVRYLSVDQIVIPLCPNNNHPHVIDLGLPSGTKWACCNVGAVSPKGYGGYYAWGETTTKSYYDWSTYKYCKGTSNTITKYCTNSDYGYNGFTDNRIRLLPSDDAATANWGSNWQMPSRDQWRELFANYTIKEWTTLNGVNGYKITSKRTGKSIFLPAAGVYNNLGRHDAGSGGFYWSRSLNSVSVSGSVSACEFFFHSNSYNTGPAPRDTGQSVRAVWKQ